MAMPALRWVVRRVGYVEEFYSDQQNAVEQQASHEGFVPGIFSRG
jgi:hypothetical protein